MYIDPFWAGVVATLASEFLALVVTAYIRSKRRRRNGNSKENN